MAFLDTLRRKRDRPGKRRVRGRLDRLGWRARAGAEGPTAQERAIALGAPGWPVIDGPHYVDVLGAMHRALRPAWYLEVGVFKGHSLAQATGAYVAVDPAFRLSQGAPPLGAQAHFFQTTSDAFFASGFAPRNGIAFDLAFLDGLHEYEALLRDVIAAERLSAPGGRIILHDCLPTNAPMAERAWVDGERVWAGDVWKTVVILRAVRPELRIVALDAWPTGLLVIEGLDPGNRSLEAAADAQIAALRDVSLERYGRDRFFGANPIQSSVAFVETLA